ncbi:HAD-IA family hydrolase [Lacticaseibacillus thailandensis]|uniref:p-Ser-HPr phosphatase n=1 Tax=Lacticaseibacillus thailandensis DSM 22698 = JCM 13996 TaxID=1423810 RepID=A0A0R2C991_9LACO|nr:HAD-IA family hydrolase [Lacticaseibacillus thailandensis]KRM88151.1 P-Ser-HPr phosphatase [Lacticaseibacillus thailandensis DSM 22698 = JCM 13996]
MDVIWDFDGTLFDTYPGMMAALREVLAGYGDTRTENELLVAAKEDSVRAILRDFTQHHPETTLAGLDQAYHAKEHATNLNPQPYPGARAALLTVVHHGGRNFLWTHRDDVAWGLLDRNNLRGMFAGGTTISMHFARKPNPESLLYLQREFGLGTHHTVVVGDRALDIDAGRAAGFATIYIDIDGLHAAPQATATADTLRAVPAVLQQMVAAGM